MLSRRRPLASALRALPRFGLLLPGYWCRLRSGWEPGRSRVAPARRVDPGWCSLGEPCTVCNAARGSRCWAGSVCGWSCAASKALGQLAVLSCTGRSTCTSLAVGTDRCVLRLVAVFFTGEAARLLAVFLADAAFFAAACFGAPFPAFRGAAFFA